MINKIFKIINNKFSRIFKFIFFLRYLFLIFFVATVLFISIPHFFDYKKREKIIINNLSQNYGFKIKALENIKFNSLPTPNFEINDLSGIGPFSVYPRTSAIETNQVLNLSAASYVVPNYKAKGTVVFQNKTPMCQYRAVGHPIAVAITEFLVDKVANALNMDR